ncbi:MAG TPA: hypothetical protein PLJ13_10195 [Cyclobacteriaceae bacterium]|nr:hypothetical protein [Cyclobacteriaceae bacterium]
MKYALSLLLFLISSCTGSLTDDQRKKIKEDMATHEIKKVTDAEVTEAAIRYGQQLAAVILREDKTLSNQPFLDSISQVYQVEIVALQESNLKLRAVERQIFEAYASGQGSDNIQKMGPDSLLYTKPITREHPDGSTEFIKALGIRMTRKQIVLTIK